MQRARHYRWGTVVVDCVHTVDDVMMRVSSSQTITRIKSSVLDFATRRETGQNPEKPSKTPVERRSPKITLAVPFLANETVALLGLSDLKDLMRLTMDVNRMDFNKHAFVSTLNEHCSRAVEGMYLATAASRGTNASISTAPIRERSSLAGDIDALVFVAFVRIFAEWRSLRLVPDGYQGYAVGMGLAKRDLIQNAHKLEVAVHKWMENNEESRRTSSGLAFGHQVRER